jgi:hypothetical protein
VNVADRVSTPAARTGGRLFLPWRHIEHSA